MSLPLTPEDIAHFHQLEHDRDRALAHGYTISNIPVNPDHEKWLKYKELKKLLNSQRYGPAPSNEHTVGQFQCPPSTNLMAALQPMFASQEQNMIWNLLLDAAASVRLKAFLFR